MVFWYREEKLGDQALEERLTNYNNEVNGKLNDQTPQFDLAT